MEQVITNPNTIEFLLQSGFAGIAAIAVLTGLVIALLFWRVAALAKTYVEHNAKTAIRQNKIAAHQAKSLHHIGHALDKLEYATRKAALAQEKLLKQQSRKLDTINEDILFLANVVKGRTNGYDHELGNKQ